MTTQQIIEQVIQFWSILFQEQLACRQQYKLAMGTERSQQLGYWSEYDHTIGVLCRIVRRAQYCDPLPALQDEAVFLQSLGQHQNLPDVFASARRVKDAELGERLSVLIKSMQTIEAMPNV